MADDTSKVGDNSGAIFAARVQRRIDLFDDADELKKTLADYKTEDKADGLTEKLVAQMVKEKRADPEKLLKQLSYEAEVEAGRKAVGLPTEIEVASKLAQEFAESAPEPKKQKKKRDEKKIVPFGKPDKSKH
jgi:hypothetical protein